MVDEAAVETAKAVWSRIGAEFNANRKQGASFAWKVYLERLNENCGILSELFTAKEIVELCMRIEERLKEQDSVGGGESGLDYARKFLDGEKVAHA